MHPLEPDRTEMERIAGLVTDRAIGFVDSLDERPASHDQVDEDLLRQVAAPPSEQPGSLEMLLDRLDEAAGCALETAGGGYFGYIPGGGVFSSAVAELYARAVNRFGGMAAFAPPLVALEQGVIRWLAAACGLPAASGGLLTTGGSMANLSAVVAARHAGLGEDLIGGRLYVTAQAHHSVTKAARIAGLPAAAVRVVPSTAQLRMDVEAAAAMIAADRTAGHRPFLLVGSAGTTDTGTIDPLPGLADLAAREGLWLHVDGAYGGLFTLTDRGRTRLRGIERADSITLDPHKSLFLPYGTGALLVRDPNRLAAAHQGGAHYLQDLAPDRDVADFAGLGVELSREVRGLRVWLPLQLHGVAAFRAALDEKLDLARTAYEALAAEPALEVLAEPELTVVGFRLRDGDDTANRRLLERINASRRVFLSSTSVHGRVVLRLCVLSHRSHAEHVDEAVRIVRDALV
ncbi:MAG: aminotransferase class V-fold PLP-dependent enzyme [Pseudonocardiaceae bacterium]|nr:aminotransferase class V-fold PLP-dependent enzyme [Pseudonocardiaceae bacterium]